MAGRLPGVGLLARKRAEQNHHRYQHSHPHLRLPPLDETALKARQRLHNKLGLFFSSYRSSEKGRKEEKNESRKVLGSSWLLRGKKLKKEKKVCSVCLEEFGKEEEVIKLWCSHKYHSACLLPWLAAHPHCPYCRTPVHSSSLTLQHPSSI